MPERVLGTKPEIVKLFQPFGVAEAAEGRFVIERMSQDAVPSKIRWWPKTEGKPRESCDLIDSGESGLLGWIRKTMRVVLGSRGQESGGRLQDQEACGRRRKWVSSLEGDSPKSWRLELIGVQGLPTTPSGEVYNCIFLMCGKTRGQRRQVTFHVGHDGILGDWGGAAELEADGSYAAVKFAKGTAIDEHREILEIASSTDKDEPRLSNLKRLEQKCDSFLELVERGRLIALPPRSI